MEHSAGDADGAGVLADRLAAALIHHEPGWRLPRPTALARRYNVGAAQIEQAIKVLAARHLIRRLPDGQLYRSSPVEYLIPVQGVPRLEAHVDPMGSEVTCRSRRVSWRRVPEEIGWALAIPPAEVACAVRCTWAVNGEPAGSSTTYLTKQAAQLVSDPAGQLAGPGSVFLPGGPGAEAGEPRPPLGVAVALHLEVQPPPAAVARGLRLSAGQSAATITVRFDEPDTGKPVAVTVATLRPDLFRIVIESSDSGSARD